MENRILGKFYNYLNIADKTKQLYPKIYYFIKSLAFSSIYVILSDVDSNETSKVNLVERAKIFELYKAFKKESEADPVSKETVTKEDYDIFLEFFFAKMDFGNLEQVYTSRDMLELSITFGQLDKLSLDRMYYFNKKIASMTSTKSDLQNKIYQFDIKNLSDSIIRTMSNFPNPITKTDVNNYSKYVNEIIKMIQSANNDIDIGGFNGARSKIEAALYYLTQIKG